MNWPNNGNIPFILVFSILVLLGFSLLFLNAMGFDLPQLPF